jgi:hypothetical protein
MRSAWGKSLASRTGKRPTGARRGRWDDRAGVADLGALEPRGIWGRFEVSRGIWELVRSSSGQESGSVEGQSEAVLFFR